MRILVICLILALSAPVFAQSEVDSFLLGAFIGYKQRQQREAAQREYQNRLAEQRRYQAERLELDRARLQLEQERLNLEKQKQTQVTE